MRFAFGIGQVPGPMGQERNAVQIPLRDGNAGRILRQLPVEQIPRRLENPQFRLDPGDKGFRQAHFLLGRKTECRARCTRFVQGHVQCHAEGGGPALPFIS